MRRLTYISDEAKDIEKGILTHKANNNIKKSNDELGILSNSFDSMRVKLTDIITKVKDINQKRVNFQRMLTNIFMVIF